VLNSGYLDLLPEMVADGHTVAVHTYSHVFSEVYASESAYYRDLNAIREKVHDYTGQWPNILRFPGGSSNTLSNFNPGIMTRLVKSVEEKGYRYFDWNVDSNDAGGASTADEVFRNVVDGIAGKKYAVVLQHDVKGFSVDAVERIIEWGLANGYTFAALTQDSPECEHAVWN
jgi:peptidoglycan/xylan/chitin deacetylase (PgdA/CDA1 family)